MSDFNQTEQLNQIKTIRISEILIDLKMGISRWKKEDFGFGSIEEKYNLNFKEMKQLLVHPKLKGMRTIIPSLIIIDDTEENTSEQVQNTPTIEVAKTVYRVETEVTTSVLEEEEQQHLEEDLEEEYVAPKPFM